MNTTMILNPNYSTTKLVTTKKPSTTNISEDKFKTALLLPEGKGRKGEGGIRTKGYFKQSSPDKPLISVITVVYNGAKTLEETILSVINQTYDNVEYIVIDGGSTDGTLDIIRKYEHVIDYWVSEKDEGIYDAMNKGIRLSQGKIIGIINSDDWYEPNALDIIASEYNKTNGEVILHGSMNIFENNSECFRSNFNSKMRLLSKGMIINHPTTFVPLAVYKKHGYFSTDYKIASDWELMLKFYHSKIVFKYIDKLLANFRLEGISNCINKDTILEKHLIRKKHNIYKIFDKYYLFDLTKLFFFLGEKYFQKSQS